MRKFFIIICFSISWQFLSGQGALGAWTSYLPFNNAKVVTDADGKIFCSTEGGLFYFNTKDNSINKFGREDGLSDIGISTIGYSEQTGILIIAYEDANIDLIYKNQIMNISDIKRKQILGDKKIYSIYFSNDLAYLACGFGVVVLDLSRKEIKETFDKIGSDGKQIKVNAITSFNDTLYCATDVGIYNGSLLGVNLIDFNNWSMNSAFPGDGKIVNTIVSTNNVLYANVRNEEPNNDIIYIYDGTKWSECLYYSGKNIRSLNVNDDQLIICSKNDFDIFSATGERLKGLYIGSPQFGIVDKDNIVWIADSERGLLRNSNSWEKVSVSPEGPSDISVAAIEISNNKLVAVAGGRGSSLSNLYKSAELYSYADGQWDGWKTDSLRDLIKIAIHPDDPNHYFAASWGYGLLEFKDNDLTELYLEHNSSLQTIFPGDDFYRLGGLCYDNQKNLWVTNSGVSEPVSVLTYKGEWESFSFNNILGTLNLGDIIVTQSGYKWIILPSGNGLFVFDDNGTLDNKDDDEFLKLSVRDKNNKIITNEIYSIAEDKNGNIWLGTNNGIVVYYSPGRVFSDEEFYAQQIIVPRIDDPGAGDPLLGSETVTCIEVDGANRKWIGTRNGGVFLVSDDGLEQIHSFNSENSPLLSNAISDIAINGNNGEVFFATDKGLISYVGEATDADQFFTDVFVFPNPVREDYFGDITISGLVENTYVKITDLNGNLVYETKSLGGRALWDGTNLHGNRVQTGVYLIFCSNEDGSLTHVTKLLFIH
jgi:TSS9, PorZ, N-terminal beta-propeller domain/Two component regulator propeller